MKPDRNSSSLHEPHEPGEEALRRLFDATADEAAGPLLTKLAARAGEVPERAQRVPRWLPRWAWSPTLAGLVVAAGVGVVVIASRVGGPERLSSPPRPTETAATTPSSTSAPKLALSPPASEPTSMHLGQEGPEADELDDALDDDDSLAAIESAETNAQFDVEGDLFDLGADPLGEPASDDDIDAWLAATADLVEDG